MFAELFYGAVVWIDGTVGAGEHNAAFHGDEDEGGEGVDVGVAGERRLHFDEAFADGFDPALEILRDEFVRRRVFRIDFESEAAERATEGAIGH